MSNSNLIVITLCSLLIIFGGLTLFNNYNNNQAIEDATKKAESEIRLKELERTLVNLRSERDSAIIDAVKSKALAEYQKKYPHIIIKNYEDKAEAINNLTPSESFELFTNNVAKLQNNWERYSLQRFKRND